METYKRFSSEITESVYPTESPEQKKRKFEEVLESVKKEMLTVFPEVHISEEMLQQEAKNREIC